MVMLSLFTGNKRNKHYYVSCREPRKGSHYLSSFSWTNRRSFSSVLAYCCWAFLWFVALTTTYLCIRSPHSSGHWRGPSGQFFSCVPRSRLDTPTLQKPQGNRWDGQTAKCSSIPLLRYFSMQPLGQFTNINWQLTLWSLMLRCSPTHSQPTLMQRTIIFDISALTAMFMFKLPGVILSLQRGHVFLSVVLYIMVCKQALQALWPQLIDTGWFISSWLLKKKIVVLLHLKKKTKKEKTLDAIDVLRELWLSTCPTAEMLGLGKLSEYLKRK